MSINKPLFDSIYDECCKIIQFSQDKMLQQKKDKLDYSYRQLCKTEDCELQEFYSIVHELRTYHFLRSNNLDITAQNDKLIGPDFLCKELGYIECISITKGSNGTKGRIYLDNQLSECTNRYMSALPRITSAIIDKKNKYETYLCKQAIEPNIPRLIAINTSIFSNEFHSDLIFDLFLKVLYGMGCPIITIQKNKMSSVNKKLIELHKFDDKGKKHGNLELQLNYFAQDDFKSISAIIAENNSIKEKIEKKYFTIFLNPIATIPLEIETQNCFQYFKKVKTECPNNYYQLFS